MFTGLVQHVGEVSTIAPAAHGVRLRISAKGWGHRPKAGASVSVAGCCLTCVNNVGPAGLLTFDVVPETLRVTTLGAFLPGKKVNLEHAVTASTFLGGHMVQGHVDGVAHVVENGEAPGGGWNLSLDIPGHLSRSMVPKGSVCIEGVSLTLAEVDPARSRIGLALIPETLARTTLGSLRRGDAVNIEADVIAKTITHYLDHFRGAWR